MLIEFPGPQVRRFLLLVSDNPVVKSRYIPEDEIDDKQAREDIYQQAAVFESSRYELEQRVGYESEAYPEGNVERKRHYHDRKKCRQVFLGP